MRAANTARRPAARIRHLRAARCGECPGHRGHGPGVALELGPSDDGHLRTDLPTRDLACSHELVQPAPADAERRGGVRRSVRQAIELIHEDITAISGTASACRVVSAAHTRPTSLGLGWPDTPSRPFATPKSHTKFEKSRLRGGQRSMNRPRRMAPALSGVAICRSAPSSVRIDFRDRCRRRLSMTRPRVPALAQVQPDRRRRQPHGPPALVGRFRPVCCL
jgi:hypothetical protein